MITRRRFMGAGAALLVQQGQYVHAQARSGVPRVCMLAPNARNAAVSYNPFFQRLRDLGYVEGQNLRIAWLSADGRAERFPALAAECVRLKADVILGGTTPASLAAKNATRSISIVLVGTGDPVATGLVDGLAKPGGAGNITGLSHMAPGLMAKRLQLLKEIMPRLSSLLVLAYLIDPIAKPQIRELEEAARAQGVMLIVKDIKSQDDLQAAVASGVREGAQALMTTVEAIFNIFRARVAELALQHKLPSISPYGSFADAGGLMSYGVNFPQFFATAAVFVDKILRGARPADLPIEQPTTFEFVINMKTARTLGVTIPQLMAIRADRIVN